uniref:Stereocilin n=1 Tax=Erpetoichthys calabaricus TaxID=27687 RepID=A0A8C4TMK9_ERPCA
MVPPFCPMLLWITWHDILALLRKDVVSDPQEEKAQSTKAHESSPVPDPNLSIEGGQQPKFKIHNMFVSLRGSQHYDGILSILQILINFLERQQNHPLFNFLWQNWDMIGTLLETIFQTLLNGSYGHGSTGLQSIFCALTGHTDCGFNLDWLQQLYRYLEAKNWKPVVNFHPGNGGIGNLNGGIQSIGQPAIEASSVLWQGLDGLRQGLFQRMGSSVYVGLKRKVSRITRSLLDDVTTLVRIPQPDQDGKCTVGKGIRNNIDWNAQMLGFASQGFPAEPPFLSCMKLGKEWSKKKQENLRKTRSIAPEPDLENIWSGTDVTAEDNFFATSELLEAACNESIPGLTGVSNFTVFLYCNLFEGNDDTVDMEASYPGVDLQSLCSDDFYSFNQTSIDNLCQQMSSGPNGSSLKSTSENCLSRLSTRVLSVQNFSQCFLPNASALIGNLCGNETTFVPVEGSWAFEFCSKNWYNFISSELGTCDIRYWTPGFRNYICHNDTIYYHLAPIHPWILRYCADPETNSGDERCFLQKIFDLLPIPYDFESSQLCQNPAPHLLEILYKLSECKGEVHELHNWIVNVNYILRLLDFILSLPSGFDTGKREVRAQLSEAILLSSLLDNTSFYGALSSNASLNVLQAVGDFLRNERNVSLKEDLLSCFSVVRNGQKWGNIWDLRSLLMSAENEAVKRFLSHMHQTWNQLQVSQQDEQAMEMMTSALLHKFPRVTPDLFVDLSQFIPFMSVSDIMSFPSLLLVNDSVLTAIRDHSSEMKPLQKRAFVKRLLQSNVLGQVPLWPPYFLRSLQPLLPYLPLCHFQQLTAEQVCDLYLEVNIHRPIQMDICFAHCLLDCDDKLFPKTRNILSNCVLYVIYYLILLYYLLFRQVGLLCIFSCIHAFLSIVYIFLFFSPEPIPSCSDLKGTFPAAWTAGQFLGMLEQELLDCLDVLGQDPELSAEQRKALWDRLKQMYVPLRSVKPEQILQLGWIVTQLSDKELQELDLSHLEIVAYMGQFDQWTPKQMRAIVLNYLKRSGQSIENLEMSKLVSFGFFICGLSPTEISRLDPKSALFLGELNLGCSELQAEALTTRIMLSDAFGPVSEWGPEIFMEIGTLAAGLPDVVLSSLIREQFEGLTPAAIGLMPASKFAVVFSPVHLSWMTPEQARAVTPHQWIELNSEQSQAVSMAQYEGELIQEQRGRGAVVLMAVFQVYWLASCPQIFFLNSP